MKIGVIGAGSMGRGICQLLATAGHQVTLIDISSKVLNEAQNFILKMLNRQVEKGRMTDADAKTFFGNIYLSESVEVCGIKILLLKR